MTRWLRLLALVALLVSTFIPAVGSVRAQDATPSATSAPSTPVEMLNALLALPFPVELLPAGLTEPVVSQWIDPESKDLMGTVGAVQIVLNNDPATTIRYLIYADQAQAETAFSLSLERGTEPIATVAATSMFNGTRVSLSYDSGEICVEQFANVILLGGVGSSQTVTDPAATACALVDAGAVHLNQVTQVRPVPVPAAQHPLTPLDQLNRLLTEPFPTTLLPAGHTQAVATAWPPDDDDLAGAVGGVFVQVDGSNVLGVSFIVYPTIAIAKTRYAALVTGIGTPTTVDDLPDSISLTTPEAAICARLADNVLVIGAGATEDEACLFAAAGVTHLAVTAPAATPVVTVAQSLLTALQTTEFPTTGLPPGFTDPLITVTTQVDDQFGSLGSIFVSVNGVMTTGIAMIVYPDPETAAHWLQQNGELVGTDHGPIGGEDGVTAESWVVTSGSYVTCLTTVDRIAIAGVVPVETENAVDAACSLALAGLGHARTLLQE
ncbi:MAG TPA: hypothetical protein PK819_02110 [Thermomicrobiales bacterium]|mgnify:CR=1 FL=1|nr:hypothetical protein [Thermomicrobiales bacterium]